MIPKTLLHRGLVALAVLVAALALPAPAGAQPGADVSNAGGVRIARPRGAVLTVYEGAAETFLFSEARTADDPLRLAPANADAGFALWADYEALFLPLTAGFGRFEISVAKVHGDALELLAEDHADIVAFGPSRRSGRLSLDLRLTPGLHEIEIASVSRVRPVGVAEWVSDVDSVRVWVFITGGATIPLASPDTPTVDTLSALAGTADVAQARVLPVGGLNVGSQRAAAGVSAVGALNFATGHDSVLHARVGQELRVWSDYELWWAEQAAASGSAVLAVSMRDAAGSAVERPRASDAHAVRDGAGPRLDDGTLAVPISFEAAGRYALIARLTTTMTRGTDAAGIAGDTATDSDVVPFTVVVHPEPPTTGNIGGVVLGRTLNLPTDPATDPIADPSIIAAGVPLEGVLVHAIGEDGHLVGATRTNADGRYRIEDLPPGPYLVHAAPAPQNYLDQWWKLATNPRNGETVAVKAGETSDGIRFLLAPGATISGKVTDASGRPLGGIEINAGAWPDVRPAPRPAPGEPGDPWFQDVTDPNGAASAGFRTRTNDEGFYAIDRLPAGAYWVRARDPQGRYRPEYFDDAASLADAEAVKAETGHVVGGIDFALGSGGIITGQVREESQLTVIIPLGGMRVEARALDDPEQVLAVATSHDDGMYRLGPLPEGRYFVRASDPEGAHHPEWYREASVASDAEPVGVREGSSTGDIHFTLAKRQRETRVFVDPRETNVPQGSEGRFAVSVAGVEELGAFEVVLKWRPGVIAVEEIVLGEFLGSTGREVVPVEPEIDNATGRLAFAAASIGREAGPSGGGVLFWVRFKALTLGETPVEIGASLLTDPAANEIAHVQAGGAIRVGGCLYADFNCDCRVDIRDVMAVIVRWGMVEGDPDWDARFDLRADGRIDIIDVQIVAGEWGARCTGEPDPNEPNPLRLGNASGGVGPDGAPRSMEVDANKAGDPDSTSSNVLAEDQRQGLPFALAGTDATLRISASPAAPRVGEMVTISVDVEGAVDLAGFELTLGYDAARLTPLGADAGPFLRSTGRTVSTLGPEFSAEGMTLGAFSLPGAEAPSGDGQLAVFRFQVLAEGSAAVSLGEALLVDSLGESGEVAAEGVTISAEPADPASGWAFIPMAARR